MSLWCTGLWLTFNRLFIAIKGIPLPSHSPPLCSSLRNLSPCTHLDISCLRWHLLQSCVCRPATRFLPTARLNYVCTDPEQRISGQSVEITCIKITLVTIFCVRQEALDTLWQSTTSLVLGLVCIASVYIQFHRILQSRNITLNWKLDLAVWKDSVWCGTSQKSRFAIHVSVYG